MVLALAAGLIAGDVVLALTLLVIGCPRRPGDLHSGRDRGRHRPGCP